MTYFHAIALGIVQGLTEFLPISSSGHLVLLPWLFKWEGSNLAFDVALHWGTLIGVTAYFRRDLKELAVGFIGSFRGEKALANRLPWLLILGTIPAGLIGLAGEDYAETVFRSPWVVSAMLASVGILLFVSDQRKGHRDLNDLNWKSALLIGAAQGIAIIPGTSRSGITICVALFLSFSRNAAVRFSFLLSIPIILAAGVLKINYLLSNLTDPAFVAGFAASAISGYAAIAFLIQFVRTRSFTPFVIYRMALAAVIALILLSGRGS